MRAYRKQSDLLLPMVHKLWPEHPEEKLKWILENYICDKESAVFLQMSGGKPVGVALCCLRHDYVEGCRTSPVGYLEGIFVEESFRKQGIARELCRECEEWAKMMGCSEFGSDCELKSKASLRFHLKTGFTEEKRIICFRKDL